MEVAHVTCPMVAEEIIELRERARYVLIPLAVNNVNSLTGVCVVKQQGIYLAFVG
jgi:hypothetical protein